MVGMAGKGKFHQHFACSFSEVTGIWRFRSPHRNARCRNAALAARFARTVTGKCERQHQFKLPEMRLPQAERPIGPAFLITQMSEVGTIF